MYYDSGSNIMRNPLYRTPSIALEPVFNQLLRKSKFFIVFDRRTWNWFNKVLRPNHIFRRPFLSFPYSHSMTVITSTPHENKKYDKRLTLSENAPRTLVILVGEFMRSILKKIPYPPWCLTSLVKFFPRVDLTTWLLHHDGQSDVQG